MAPDAGDVKRFRYSGSDDSLCKVRAASIASSGGERGSTELAPASCSCTRRTLQVWDRRSLRDNQPVGVMAGHREGITYIHPKVIPRTRVRPLAAGRAPPPLPLVLPVAVGAESRLNH